MGRCHEPATRLFPKALRSGESLTHGFCRSCLLSLYMSGTSIYICFETGTIKLLARLRALVCGSRMAGMWPRIVRVLHSCQTVPPAAAGQRRGSGEEGRFLPLAPASEKAECYGEGSRLRKPVAVTNHLGVSGFPQSACSGCGGGLSRLRFQLGFGAVVVDSVYSVFCFRCD